MKKRALQEYKHCNVMISNIKEAAAEAVGTSLIDMQPEIFEHECVCEARSLGIQYVANASADVLLSVVREADVNWDNFVQGLNDTEFSELQYALTNATK